VGQGATGGRRQPGRRGLPREFSHSKDVRRDGSSSSTPAGTEPLTYAWDFGDGTTGEGVTASHTHSQPGRYLISLKVTNGVLVSGTASATVTISCAGGHRIRGSSDQIEYIHQQAQGDFAVVVRITDSSGGGTGAFAGPMIRESLDPGARYAAIFVEQGATTLRTRFRARVNPGETAQGFLEGTPALPHWLRLERRGDEFIAFARADGEEWTEIRRQTIPGMPDRLFAGIAAAGQYDIADAIAILNYLFTGGPMACVDAADVDDDGRAIISDAGRLVYHLFVQAPPPAAPYPGCGADPSDDDLSCEAYGAACP